MVNKGTSNKNEITGNIFLQRADHSLGNFLQFNKEILRKKHNNKPISLETIGMFARLLSVAEYTGDNAWNYSNEGMARTSGCSSEKISRCMNELKQLGYVKRIDYKRTSDGRFGKNLYIVYETANSELWDKNNLIEFDSELKDSLIEFFTVVIDTRKRMNESTFRNMMEDLEELSGGNLDLKKKIVKTSLRKGWLAFYPVDAKQKGISAAKSIPRKREYTAEERAKMSRLARDENGEILKF